MKIKVCGITCFEQMYELQSLGADYAGMIFYEGSKRYVDDKMKNEKQQIRNLQIKKVGIFVNADSKNIEEVIEEYGLDAIQLHGDETAEFCNEFKHRVEVIKAFRISGTENIAELFEPYEKTCHYFLFDTAPFNSPGEDEFHIKTLLNEDADITSASSLNEVSGQMASPIGGSWKRAYGGSGKQFDWKILKNADITKPFFLSGGIGLEDVERIKQFHHPQLYAVDVNSRFETEPGFKDLKKVEKFIQSINHG